MPIVIEGSCFRYRLISKTSKHSRKLLPILVKRGKATTAPSILKAERPWYSTCLLCGGEVSTLNTKAMISEGHLSGYGLRISFGRAVELRFLLPFFDTDQSVSAAKDILGIVIGDSGNDELRTGELTDPFMQRLRIHGGLIRELAVTQAIHCACCE